MTWVERHVKFGFEVKTESFAWRLVHACGYFAEPSFLVPSGGIDGLGTLRRSDPSLHADGQFTNARFQYRDGVTITSAGRGRGGGIRSTAPASSRG
jgi:hypothetical protein